ncbi:MAG: ABC transporter permease [Alphaproteobacteria bacterium]|nr:ABC transporter permease [Alphaproteobacteria bacterium]
MMIRQNFLREIAHNKVALVSLFVFMVFVLFALFPSFFAAQTPDSVTIQDRMQGFSFQHFLGTDDIGRDLFSRIVYGTRTAFIIVICTMLFSVPFGVCLGVIAGYRGGFLQKAALRFTDVWISIPRLVVAMMVPALFGRTGWGVMIVSISVAIWPAYTRLACVETIQIKESDFIHIARLQGASFLYILRYHLAPIVLPSAVVRASLDCSTVVLTAASLGFLGLGVSTDVPEWGYMAAQGSSFLLTHPWVAIVPGGSIFLLSFSMNSLGDALRDVLNPKEL